MSRNITAGIDVGTHSVKVVIASARERNDHGLPVIRGIGVAETRGMRHGYVTSIADVAASIRIATKMAEDKAGVKVKKAFVGIGGIGLGATTVTSTIITSRADAEITELDLDKLREQCEKDMPQQARANRRIIYEIPVQYRIDNYPSLGAPLGMTANKIEQKNLYITCLEHHVNDLISAVNEAGIEVEDLMASPIAAGFVTLSKAQKIAGCVLVSVGSETVSIAVFENNIPTSLEVFPIGSTDITNDIALGLKVSLEEAEQIKIGAITGASYPRKKLEEIIEARLYDVFDLIDDHLRAIKRNGLLPAGIIITGGGAALSGIDELAKSALKLPSRIATVPMGDGKTSTRDNLLSIAYGLCAWGQHVEEGPEIDPTADFVKHLFKRLGRGIKQLLP